MLDLKILKQNTRKILEEIGTDHNFLNRIPIAQEISA
jgi:hypothetical protein